MSFNIVAASILICGDFTCKLIILAHAPERKRDLRLLEKLQQRERGRYRAMMASCVTGVTCGCGFTWLMTAATQLTFVQAHAECSELPFRNKFHKEVGCSAAASCLFRPSAASSALDVRCLRHSPGNAIPNLLRPHRSASIQFLAVTRSLFTEPRFKYAVEMEIEIKAIYSDQYLSQNKFIILF